MNNKTCIVCKCIYKRKSNNQKYCSYICAKQANLSRSKLYQKLHKKDRKKYLKLNHTHITKITKEYYETHKEKLNELSKEWKKNNAKENQVYMTKYRKNNKKRIAEVAREYVKNRLKTDINFKIACCLRNRVGNVLRGKNKSMSTIDLLGCSISFFIKYYQSKFTQGMKWDKVLNGEIHCDHIKPCASFDLSKPDEQRKCFNYTNLQPLWAKDNLIKKDKYLNNKQKEF